MISFSLNGKPVSVDVDQDTPLIWVLRDELGLMGTKYTCERGICGVCVVLLDGTPVRACVTSLLEAQNRNVLTIEGLAQQPEHPVLQAWLEQQVSQCGYCQPGQILTAAALLNRNPSPTDAEIDSAMDSVLCRCGSYQRIRRAIHLAAANMPR